MSDPTPSRSAPAQSGRSLIRAADRGVLATNLRDSGGWPFSSLVMLAVDYDASPILLISDLAEHTKNLAADPRASLLIDGTAGLREPLTGPRLTLQGRVERDASLGRRYLARHPSAAMFAGFKDFNFYRFVIERGHFVAGFGQIRWLDSAALCRPTSPAMIAAEPVLITRLMQDGQSLLQNRVGPAPSEAGWTVTGIDADGIDLAGGDKSARINLAQPIDDPTELLAVLATPV